MRLMLNQALFFFFNDTATTEIYTLSLHDALPIYGPRPRHERVHGLREPREIRILHHELHRLAEPERPGAVRSEEHTSELQSLAYLVCRLLLEKKKKKQEIEQRKTDK